jgi:hypothetical protein
MKLEKKSVLTGKISSWFQTGKKIQFIKLDILNWRIGKIQFR